MQEGRGPGPSKRGSADSLQMEQPAASSEVPGTLKTNAAIYAGAVSPDRRKLVSSLVGGVPHCPDHQPRAPFSPPGVAITDTWRPFYVVPLPPKLVFATWWHEGPNKRVNMHVTFDTATRRCLAGTYVSLDMEVTTTGGAPVDEYDLHVGAELRVAERKVTLRKAVTLATLSWLDQQARAMLITKYRLEQELLKFRPVVPVAAQYPEARRAELFDMATHQHLPAGGRVNLRSLYNFILALLEQLRQHRPRLPRLPEAVAERLTAVAEAMPGPPDWSPERREMERREAEERMRQSSVESEPSDDETWRNDLTNWIESIPLAASCCLRYPGKAAAGAAAGVSGSGLGGHGGAGGHGEGKPGFKDREKGARSIKIVATGGAGGGHKLAFNMSVVNRIGGARLLNGGASAAVSRAPSMVGLPAAPGARGLGGGMGMGPSAAHHR